MDQKNVTDKKSDLDHERLVSLVNSLADAVIAVDEHVNVVIFNGAALDILDVNTMAAGDSLSSLMTLIDKEGNEVELKSHIVSCSTQKISRDYRLKYDEDELVNIYLSIAPVHLGYSTAGIRGYVLLIRDITREKSLEEERDEFISVVSHELRTPITIAEGNLSNALFLTQKHDLPEIIETGLRQSYDQVLLLAGMINDLSTLSRAERGVLKVEPEELNGHDIVKLLAEEYKDSAGAKGLTVNWHADPDLELIYSSKLYVREILQNFITNSIKYTEEGGITLEAKKAEGGISFEVSDTGIGISKSDQEKVFDKFFRSEDFRTRQSNGTGLGLYVTMKLVRLIGAKLDVDSRIDGGSTFTVFVPDLKLPPLPANTKNA